MERDFFNYEHRCLAEDLLAKQTEADKLLYSNITRYMPDGFTRVCDVDNLTSTADNWSYTNVNNAFMFSDHRSWVYFLTLNLAIMKIGETEQPLGIETHPNSGVLAKTTESRLGRYRKHDKEDRGDHAVRQGPNEDIKLGGVVSFWAKPCEIIRRREILGSDEILVPYTTHKFMEKYYQDFYIEKVGQLPPLNKIKK